MSPWSASVHGLVLISDASVLWRELLSLVLGDVLYTVVLGRVHPWLIQPTNADGSTSRAAHSSEKIAEPRGPSGQRVRTNRAAARLPGPSDEFILGSECRRPPVLGRVRRPERMSSVVRRIHPSVLLRPSLGILGRPRPRACTSLSRVLFFVLRSPREASVLPGSRRSSS